MASITTVDDVLVDSVDFAVYLNRKANEKNLNVNVTKIQKWLYICYGIYLAIYEKQLLNEKPKVWEYGPVFEKVHTKQIESNGNLDNYYSSVDHGYLKKFDGLIDETLKHFGSWTSEELFSWTHEEGKAWDKRKTANGMRKSMDNLNIMADFKELLPDE